MDHAYTGIWRNRNDKEDILSGPTLTVSPTQGPFLIAFLAIFVGVACQLLWAIGCFILHQARSTPDERDGLHHQIQAILRNGPGSFTFLWMLARLSWIWRRRRSILRQTTLLWLLALFHVAATIIAAIFSSRITSSGNEVLVRSSSCDWIRAPPELTLSGAMNNTYVQNSATGAFTIGRITAARCLQYGRACYNTTNSADQSACNLYTTKAIRMTTNNSIPCPFDNKICGSKHAVSVDTGLVDSNTDLGLNTEPSDRIRFRKILTCAPTMAEERYSSGWETPSSQIISGDRLKYYYLGQSLRPKRDSHLPATTGFELPPNASFAVANYTLWQPLSSGYYISSLTSRSDWQNDSAFSTFTPIPELQVPNSDISIILLQSALGYTSPVQDPWFRATSTRNNNLTNSTRNYIGVGFEPPAGTELSYFPDRIASVLGCTEQYQFCNTTHCSEVAGVLRNISRPYLDLVLNDNQKAIFNLILTAVVPAAFPVATFYFGQELLLARERIWSGGMAISATLPPNQWEAEVTNMANIMMAAVQLQIVDFASPPNIQLYSPTGMQNSRSFVLPLTSKAERGLCDVVRARNSAYYNFNVVALFFVVALGTSIILINMFCIPGVGFWVQRKLRKDNRAGMHAQSEWVHGHLLRLQCTVLENNGERGWVVGAGGEIPHMEGNRIKFPAERVWVAREEEMGTIAEEHTSKGMDGHEVERTEAGSSEVEAEGEQRSEIDEQNGEDTISNHGTTI